MTDSTPDVPQKQCSKCKEWLPATAEYFHKSARHPGGLVSACKGCVNRQTREARAPYRLPKPEQRPGFKRCSKCNEWKPVDRFHSRTASKDGLAPRCKDCISAERNLGRVVSRIKDGKKNCTACGEWFPATTEYFNKAANNPTGLASSCKDCFKRLYAPSKPKKARAKKNGKATTVICTECGKTFIRLPHEIRKDGINYCSLQCAAIGKGKRSRGKNSPHYSRSQVPCAYCGATLLRTASKIKHNTAGHFCNGECYGKWREQNMVGEASTRWTEKVVTECLQCHVEMTLIQSQVRDPGNFCSRECYSGWRKENMVGDDSPLWKGGRLPSYGGSWKRQQYRARKRDDHTCQHCGATKEEMGREPDVHHILPFRLFGVERHEEANHLSNLVCLCKRCHGIAELRDYVPDQSE